MTVGKLRFAICVWFLFMCESCLCRFVVENNSLKVSSPENLKGTYECAVSNFGVPKHGGTLTGVVVYPKVNQNGCNSFTDHEYSFKTKTHAGSLPVFLLVDGSDCYFTLKARNAQNAGAAGILIANDEFLTTMYSLAEEVDAYDMENLTIPSALISRSLGYSIKKALYNDEFVRVNLEWTEEAFAHRNEQVDMNKNIDECQSNCDDQIEEYEWDVDLPFDYMLRFTTKSTRFWGFLMLYVKSWAMFLWDDGIIENVWKMYKL
ncbi:hypothetical protein L1987_03637 [Smallanthus sonchifolius]|uniref:Uncharacterized protein n=1 Tax=Smallanthus sonchifolius TaxID=185202 RepID=A0ACB9KB82_9ASTR|nr:hypothetical protein L1987_03637 [Smallanthus sonchifolius]